MIVIWIQTHYQTRNLLGLHSLTTMPYLRQKERNAISGSTTHSPRDLKENACARYIANVLTVVFFLKERGVVATWEIEGVKFHAVMCS